VKRHAALIPLSHDHHHGLSEARRLRKASNEDDGTREASVERFFRFYRDETVDHFRLEEERVLPLLTDCDDPAETLVTRTLLEHQHIRSMVAKLAAGHATGNADPSLMQQLAELLEHHIRFEERQLFPYIEQTIANNTLDQLDRPAARQAAGEPVIDLTSRALRGALWQGEPFDLNVTLLAWDANGGPPEHINTECDVLVLVLSGSATLTIDGEPHLIRDAEAVLLKAGQSRKLKAGSHGVRYLSVHKRRAPLQSERP
jgi:quercetin dioxygenase-like cupin family protein